MPLFKDLPKTWPGKTVDTEKLIFSVAKFILESAMLTRREGILALEDVEVNQYGELTGNCPLVVSEQELPLSDEAKAIVRLLFHSLVDGMEWHDLFDIAFYSMRSSAVISYYDDERLAVMMVIEGLRGIHHGANPRVLFSKIAAMTGDVFCPRLLSVFDEWESEIINRRWPPKDAEPSHEAFDICKFEDIVLQSDSVVKKAVIENMGILASALVGVDTEVKNKVMRCVPPGERERIEKEITHAKEPSVIAQERIVAAVKKCLTDTDLAAPNSWSDYQID